MYLSVHDLDCISIKCTYIYCKIQIIKKNIAKNIKMSYFSYYIYVNYVK